MMLSLRRSLPVLLCALGLVGCGANRQEQAATSQPRSVRVAPVELRLLASDLHVSGRLVPREEAAVTSQLSGYQVAAVYVDQGADVHAGQVLARLDDSLLRADLAQQQANLAQQQIAAEKAEQDAARVTGLENSGVLSEEAIAERGLGARTARAAVDQARAMLNAQQVRQRLMTIRAPVSGRVLERGVRPGDVSSASSVMFRIAREDRIELEAEIPEQSVNLVRVGESAEVVLPDGVGVTGVVRLVSPEVDLATNLAKARILLPRSDALRPGGFAQAVLHQSAGVPVRVIPAAAVQYGANGATVVVVGRGDIVSTSSVTIGRRSGGYVELLDGPPPGARVLVGGQGFVLDGDKVAPIPSGRAAG